MAETNPTGDSRLVSLDLQDAQALILRSDLGAWIESLEADLRDPDRLEDPHRTRADLDGYRRLLDAVKEGGIRVPDPEAARLLREAADAHDEESGYAEVVATHDAMHALLAALAEGEG
ncbi:MAG TPA: hypothetical protein VFP57_10555 [Sphingomicrobium sp.]|nr:hypothetical protein [Sphingomicrobium sp.]